MTTPTPTLFAPLVLRDITLRNRLVVSPMCQYSAVDGVANDWHFAHLARFALGGFGLVFTEATAVHRDGRITHGDLGLWNDEQIAPLRRIAGFLKSHGAMPGIQLGHAGRKASMQRPWHGNGPMDASDTARGEETWRIVAPSPLPIEQGWLVPSELTRADMNELRECWRRSVLRAVEAGFEVVEIHGAHGYLLAEFLSPAANRRNDAYGGDREGRMRFPLEIAETVRAAWPKNRPVFFRVSSLDGVEGGWSLDDTVALARALKARDIDVVDCSSGGIAGSATAANIPRAPGFQVPFAERVKREAGIKTMAVGLILEPEMADAVIRDGKADLVALRREALYHPNWPLHAQRALSGEAGFEHWPVQAGWWLERRERGLRALRESLGQRTR
ncbi:MAG TPA: NADH:flavin oxidoreductase/NADH oxidase [Stellaceae bacterium]|nr:NADH:flavin oxidoreductase/NADH oxidase [Stellaceae bacterium]